VAAGGSGRGSTRLVLPRKSVLARGPSSAQKTALVVAGVLLGLLAAEGACRFLYTAPWYEGLLDDQVRRNPTQAVRRNSLGLRDIDYASPKPPGVKRVLFLGDSFTFGSGVERDDAVFPELVEQRLAGALRAQGDDVEVLNAGVPGSLTDEWIQLLGRAGPVFQPDVVVAVFFLRDGTPLSSILDFFGAIRNGIVRRNRESALYRNSYLYRAFRDRIDHRQVSTDYARDMNLAYIGDEKQTREWAKAKENLKAIAAESQRMGARFGLVVFPVLADLDEDRYPFDHVCRLIAQFGHEQAWPTLDLLPAFLGRDATKLWVTPYNQHPNEQGHRIAADAIVPFVRALLARPEAPAPGGEPAKEEQSYPQA